MKKTVRLFPLWLLLTAVLFGGVGTSVATASSTKKSVENFCKIEKTLQIPALDKTILSITATMKALKMVCAAERQVYVAAKKQKVAVDGLRKTAKLLGKIKYFKPVAVAFLPFGNTVYKTLDKTQKVSQGKVCNMLAPVDDVWNVLGGAIYAIKAVSTGLCKKTKVLGFTICKGFKSGGFGDKQCGGSDDAVLDDGEPNACGSSTGLSSTQLRQRTALLRLTSRSNGLINRVHRSVSPAAKAIASSRRTVLRAKKALEPIKKTLNGVKAALGKLGKSLSPVTKVTNKIQKAMKKRLCVKLPQIRGRVADCPRGYTNNGATCGRGTHIYRAPSRVASCPRGYRNMGLTCFRGASTYGKKCTTIFKKFPCRRGYTDNGCFCGRGAKSLSAKHMKCPRGYFKSKITKRCHKKCKSGYRNDGETCHRPASTLGMGKMRCKRGEVKKGARCYDKNDARLIGMKKYCTTPEEVLSGGKVGKAIMSLLDKAIDKIMSPLAKELQKLLPKVKIPDPTGAVKKLKQPMTSMTYLMRRLKKYKSLKNLSGPYKGLVKKVDSIRRIR